MLPSLIPGLGTQPAHGGAHALPRGSRASTGARTHAPQGSEGGTFLGALTGFASPVGKTQVTREWQSDESEEVDAEEDAHSYLVKTQVQNNVYGACFVVAMRGLRDQKLGTVIMSWIWVALSIFLTVVAGWEILQDQSPLMSGYVSGPEFGQQTQKSISHRLQQAVAGESPLKKHNDTDKALVVLCRSQPSLEFALVIQFIWASRCMGQFTESRTLLSLLISCPVKDLRSLTVIEENGDMTIAALMPFDALFFALALVLPQFLMAVLLWWAGSRNLAYADDFMDLLFRAVGQHYITTIERQVFRNFVAHSKKEWVTRVQVVQERSLTFRIFLSWPGEAAKLVMTAALLGIVIHHYRTMAHIRDLCFDCMHTCPNKCSKEIMNNTCPGTGAADIQWSHVKHLLGS